MKVKKDVPKILDSVHSDDELAGGLITLAVCEFKKRTGKIPRATMDAGFSEFILGSWLNEMKAANAMAENSQEEQ